MEIANAHFFVKDIYDIDSNSIDSILIDSNSIDSISNDSIFNDSDNIGFYNDSKFHFDTAITNPPFGAQSRAKRGVDRIFMELSMKSADVVYSFHMAETEDFVKNYYRNLGGEITYKFYYKFPLIHSYEFHKKESLDINVVVFRVEKI